MFWGAGSVIRKLTINFTVATTFLMTLLLPGCLQSTFKQAKPHVEIPLSTTKYIEVNHPVNTNESVPVERLAKTEEDTWAHIRTGKTLGVSDDSARKSIQTQLKSYTDNQRFFNIMSTRAQPFLYYIVEELDKRNMPRFLALLPIVESGYRPDASSSWQASGLWQIIPSTGKHFGLKQNWWYDGRKDIVASTGAALDFLQQLHDRFEDWPLALAAYNSGGATVSNAIRKNQKLGRSTDYWSLDLPPETKLYIPKLIALELVVLSPSSYGVKLPHIAYKPAVKMVDTKGQIQLEKASELANVDIEELKKLNAGFKRWATDPDGPHRLLVPFEFADRLTFAISMLADEDRVKWQHHEIKSGESLWVIAKKYEISINLLKTSNHLKTDKLRIGKNLLIPAGSFPESIVAAAPETTIKMPVLKGNKYKVKSGDSLWLIARRFDIHVQQILDWNLIKKDQPLKPGVELKILLEKPILGAVTL